MRWIKHLAIFCLAFGALLVCAYASETPINSSETGWYISGLLGATLIGWWIKTFLDKDKCDSCGLKIVKKKLNGIEWLIVRLCENAGINADERREYLGDDFED